MIVHKCLKPGCNRLVKDSSKYCKQHTNYNARQYDHIRMHRKFTRDYRLFYQSKAWKDLRAVKLAHNPLCENCLKHNKYNLATDIHHKLDVFNHPSQKLKIENLQSLCKPCHEKIHKLGYYRYK